MKIPEILGFCISIIILISIASAQPQPDASLVLSVSPENANPGDIVTVTATVENVEELFAYEVTLNFNDALVEYLSHEQGSFLGGLFINGLPEDNRVRQIAETLTPPATGKSGSGALFTITFKTKTASNCEFSLTDVSLIDSALDTITEYKISSYEATPQTGGTAPPSQPPRQPAGDDSQLPIIILAIVIIVALALMLLLKPFSKMGVPKKAAKKK